MILLDRYILFNISADGFFLFHQRFHIEFFKMAAYPVLHFHIACQMICIAPGTQTVFRTAIKSLESNPRQSPDVYGNLNQL